MFRVDDRHVVRVQKQNFLKRTMEDGVRFEFPSAQLPDGMLLSHPGSIGALDSERGQEGFHFPVKFARAQMPQLNRQPAPQPPRISSSCCCEANTSGIGPCFCARDWITPSLRADFPLFVGPLSACTSTL